MSSCLGTEGLDLSSISLHPSTIGSLGISSCLVTIRRLFLMIFRGRSLGYCVDGRPLNLVCYLLWKKKSFINPFGCSYLTFNFPSFVLQLRSAQRSRVNLKDVSGRLLNTRVPSRILTSLLTFELWLVTT